MIKVHDIGAPDNLMGPNGMVYDQSRKKLLIAHRAKGLVSLDPNTLEEESLSPDYQGMKFNGPNDLIVDSRGHVFFTDAWRTDVTNMAGKVYHWDAERGQTTVFMENLAFPNGILLSPDEKYIDVCEFGQNRLLRAFLLDQGRGHIFLHVMTHFSGGCGPDSMGMDMLACPPKTDPVFVRESPPGEARKGFSEDEDVRADLKGIPVSG